MKYLILMLTLITPAYSFTMQTPQKESGTDEESYLIVEDVDTLIVGLVDSMQESHHLTTPQEETEEEYTTNNFNTNSEEYVEDFDTSSNQSSGWESSTKYEQAPQTDDMEEQLLDPRKTFMYCTQECHTDEKENEKLAYFNSQAELNGVLARDFEASAAKVIRLKERKKPHQKVINIVNEKVNEEEKKTGATLEKTDQLLIVNIVKLYCIEHLESDAHLTVPEKEVAKKHLNEKKSPEYKEAMKIISEGDPIGWLSWGWTKLRSCILM